MKIVRSSHNQFFEPNANKAKTLGLLKNRVLSWADEYGVRVHQVNPAYTSQTCSGCGHCAKENRSGGAVPLPAMWSGYGCGYQRRHQYPPERCFCEPLTSTTKSGQAGTQHLVCPCSNLIGTHSINTQKEDF